MVSLINPLCRFKRCSQYHSIKHGFHAGGLRVRRCRTCGHRETEKFKGERDASACMGRHQGSAWPPVEALHEHHAISADLTMPPPKSLWPEWLSLFCRLRHPISIPVM